jgi:hypothetical protein
LFLDSLGEKYKIVEEGYPLYYDKDHLSVRGAQYLSPLFNGILSFEESEENSADNNRALPVF